MAKLEKPAILVVDMLNDFVTGALTCDRAKAIVPATAELWMLHVLQVFL